MSIVPVLITALWQQRCNPVWRVSREQQQQCLQRF